MSRPTFNMLTTVAVNRVRTTSRFLVTLISLLVGVWLGVLLSWLTVNIGCDWRVLSRRALWLVKWCLRGFEVSDKYREQRHFSRLVHDNTVIGNISEIVVTVGYSSLLIKKFGNYIISLLYLIPFMICVRILYLSINRTFYLRTDEQLSAACTYRQSYRSTPTPMKNTNSTAHRAMSTWRVIYISAFVSSWTLIRRRQSVWRHALFYVLPDICFLVVGHTDAS